MAKASTRTLGLMEPSVWAPAEALEKCWRDVEKSLSKMSVYIYIYIYIYILYIYIIQPSEKAMSTIGI